MGSLAGYRSIRQGPPKLPDAITDTCTADCPAMQSYFPPSFFQLDGAPHLPLTGCCHPPVGRHTPLKKGTQGQPP